MPNMSYFEWLYDKVCPLDSLEYDEVRFTCLLKKLHSTEFTYTILMDKNRASDGISLRRNYLLEVDGFEDDVPDGPCSVLEMTVALAIRCEVDIMDNPKVGDRTYYWFWCMVKSLGLGFMYNELYDEEFAESTIDRFLKREYNYDGSGGLFTISDTSIDLRDVEIWHQMCWWLDRYIYS